MLYVSLLSVVLLFVVSEFDRNLALEIHSGHKDYSTYYEGDAPIILLSQHGGYEEPSDIDYRLDGCWDPIANDCDWHHDCTNTLTRDSKNCKAKTIRDSYTKQIAECLRTNTYITIDGLQRTPHLIVNELHRNRLDANREKDEAAQFNTDAELTWEDIHNNFMVTAKQSALDVCGFGLVIDIHGQANNSYQQFGYRLTRDELELSNTQLDLISDESTIHNLVDSNGYQLSEVVRGVDSLGSLMASSTYGSYLTVPSQITPFMPLPKYYYYRGGFGIETHGSEDSGTIDAIQIEVSADIRFDSTKRQDFCEDFGAAIVTFVEHWYDLNDCVYPTPSPTKRPTAPPCGYCQEGLNVRAAVGSTCDGLSYADCYNAIGQCSWVFSACEM